MKDYKSLCAQVTICLTLVNIHTRAHGVGMDGVNTNTDFHLPQKQHFDQLI